MIKLKASLDGYVCGYEGLLYGLELAPLNL